MTDPAAANDTAWLASSKALVTARQLAVLPLAPYTLLDALDRGRVTPVYATPGDKVDDPRSKRVVASLCARGYAATIAMPQPGGPAIDLAYLTDRGRAALGAIDGWASTASPTARGGDAPGLLAAIAQGPQTIALYRALTTVLRAAPGHPTVHSWTIVAADGEHPTAPPAVVSFGWETTGRDGTIGTQGSTLALLAVPPSGYPAAWRSMLAAYFTRRVATPDASAEPRLTIVAEHGPWVQEWYALVEDAAAPHGLDGGRWSRCGVLDLLDPDGRRIVPPGVVGHPDVTPPAPRPSLASDRPDLALDGPVDTAPDAATSPTAAPLVDRALAAASASIPILHLRTMAWDVLEAIAHWPYLRLDLLALRQCWALEAVHQSVADLTMWRLIRPLDPADPREAYPTAARRAAASALCAEHPRLEVTVTGLTALADRAGLPLLSGVVYGGWSGGGPGRDGAGRPEAVGLRAVLAADPAHGDGVYFCCAAISSAAERENRRTGTRLGVPGDAVGWWFARGTQLAGTPPGMLVRYIRDGVSHEALLLWEPGDDGPAASLGRLTACRATIARFVARYGTVSLRPTLLVVARSSVVDDQLLVAARDVLADVPVRVLTTTKARAIADERLLLGSIWRIPAFDGSLHAWIDLARTGNGTPTYHPDWLAPLDRADGRDFHRAWAAAGDGRETDVSADG